MCCIPAVFVQEILKLRDCARQYMGFGELFAGTIFECVMHLIPDILICYLAYVTPYGLVLFVLGQFFLLC